MEWSVVESVNIHKAIKYGLPERDIYIRNYIETLKNLAENNIKVVCYNFMQLIDWTRTSLNYELPTEAISLLYDPVAIAAFDLFVLKRDRAAEVYGEPMVQKAEQYCNTIDQQKRELLKSAILAGMPGSKVVIALADFRSPLEEVSKSKKPVLRENLAYFFKGRYSRSGKAGNKNGITSR